MSDQQIVAQPDKKPSPFDDIEQMAIYAADSGMFGITKQSQAMCLFAICRAEKIDPISALRRYHIIEGKPSMRADAMLSDFLKVGGGVIWHVRSDEMVAATWFESASKIDDKARDRGSKRFDILWELTSETNPAKRGQHFKELSKLAVDGEETILRTYYDCEQKGLTQSSKGGTKTNWATSPRQMLTARNATEGIRIVRPGLIAGISEESEVRDAIESERKERIVLLTPQQRERQAIQEMMDQHIETAKNATNDVDRKHYQGLASELRCKLAEMDGGTVVKGTGGAPDSTATPIRTVDATDAVVEPPVKDDPAKDQIPGLEVTPPGPPDWQNYELKAINKKGYTGRKLSEFSKEIIQTLYTFIMKKDLPSATQDMKTEAGMIFAAYQHHFPADA